MGNPNCVWRERGHNIKQKSFHGGIPNHIMVIDGKLNEWAEFKFSERLLTLMPLGNVYLLPLTMSKVLRPTGHSILGGQLVYYKDNSELFYSNSMLAVDHNCSRKQKKNNKSITSTPCDTFSAAAKWTQLSISLGWSKEMKVERRVLHSFLLDRGQNYFQLNNSKKMSGKITSRYFSFVCKSCTELNSLKNVLFSQVWLLIDIDLNN